MDKYIEKHKDIIFIPGHVPSSKNSRQWTGKYSVASKSVQKYKKESKEFWESEREKFKGFLKGLKKPYKIGFHFIRKTSHKYDFINPLQTVQDLMQQYEWIEDDNISIMLPIPLRIKHRYTTIDKSNAGVIIKVLRGWKQ